MVEEEANEFGACSDGEGVVQLGMGQACNGEGDLNFFIIFEYLYNIYNMEFAIYLN